MDTSHSDLAKARTSKVPRRHRSGSAPPSRAQSWISRHKRVPTLSAAPQCWTPSLPTARSATRIVGDEMRAQA